MNCENCEENEAKYRLTVTTIDGETKDTVALCSECINLPNGWYFEDALGKLQVDDIY